MKLFTLLPSEKEMLKKHEGEEEFLIWGNYFSQCWAGNGQVEG